MKTKRILSMLLLSLMLVFSTGCGAGAGETSDSASSAESAGDENTEAVTEDTASAEQTQDSAQTAPEENASGDENDGEAGSGDTANEDTSQAQEDEEDEAEEAEEESDTQASGDGVLVIYFSRTGEQYGVGVIDKGNTEIVADMIIEETGADRFEIVPADDYYPYTYDELTDIAKQEQNENARPAYAGEAPDMSGYSTIFIGAPVWWGDWPMICYTFFEENAEALSGKTLIPFSTHAGSGLSGFDSKLAGTLPDSTVGTGLAISGSDAQNNRDSVRSTVNSWISGIEGLSSN